jgi:hypothetical protein
MSSPPESFQVETNYFPFFAMLFMLTARVREIVLAKAAHKLTDPKTASREPRRVFLEARLPRNA